MPLSSKILHIIISILGGLIMLFAGYLFTLEELFSAIFLMGFGLLFFCFGFVPLMIHFFKIRKRNHLLKNGIKIEAQVIGIKANRSVAINHKHPFFILCQWQDPLMPTQWHQFRSENIWFSPKKYLTETISVYVDKNNYKRYYVDLDFLPK